MMPTISPAWSAPSRLRRHPRRTARSALSRSSASIVRPVAARISARRELRAPFASSRSTTKAGTTAACASGWRDRLREGTGMSVFQSIDFSDHEQVIHAADPASGLRAIIAIHSTALGPAIGGCRILPYEDEASALRDVLRLSQGMSLKAAVAGVPFGGAKMVVLADPRREKSPRLLRAIGTAVERLGGRFITGEDVGTTVDD